MEILLGRHGESAGNKDRAQYLLVPDHGIPLSEHGHVEAHAAGCFLDGWLPKHWPGKKVRVWNSPYLRARETTDDMLAVAGDHVADRREHVMLGEQQFGLFTGLDLDGGEPAERYPDDWEHYQLTCEMEGRFWARPPRGESRCDVATRVHQSFGTFHRDAERHGIEHLIIVCHGTTLRAFVMMWLGHPFEWFESEANPANCAIRYISDDVDHGYVWPGGIPA